MAEFSIRSDAVDVEQIMRQIRARIREKRGADYSEREIRELANAKLETFLDPSRVRSDLLEQFRTMRRNTEEPPVPNFAFEGDTIFDTHRPLIRFMRRLLQPVLKLFFNANPIAEALHIQAQLNTRNAEQNAKREHVEALYYELIHNLVVEITRLGIEVKTMKMKVESVAARLDFDERRGRALEGSVLYRPSPVTSARPPREAAPVGQMSQAPAAGGNAPALTETGAAAERHRRRRRRGRRRGAGSGEAGAQADRGGQQHAAVPTASVDGAEPEAQARGNASLAPDDTSAGDASSHRDEPES